MGRNVFTLGRILQCIILQMITNYSDLNGHLPQLKIFASLKIQQKQQLNKLVKSEKSSVTNATPFINRHLEISDNGN